MRESSKLVHLYKCKYEDNVKMMRDLCRRNSVPSDFRGDCLFVKVLRASIFVLVVVFLEAGAIPSRREVVCSDIIG
jgi:hypothetical protein